MKKQIYQWLTSILVLTSTTYGYAERSVSNKSNEAFATLGDVQEYLNKRGFIEARKRDGILRLAGDVRARWLFAREDIVNPPDNILYSFASESLPQRV